MKNFALVGAAGFIAERHMKAIKETGNQIIAANDVFDVMGRMDSFFPGAEFFLSEADFESFVHQQQKTNNPVEYTSICSPNFMHRGHILSALRNRTSVICEKPLVLFPEDIDEIVKAELSSGRQVFNILQLRLHPAIIALRNKIQNDTSDKIYDIDLTYITSRGKWYFKSWKGDPSKSGGIATNIGIHFFDMLQWIFGSVEKSTVHFSEPDKAAGFLQLKKARARWFLSLDYSDIPQSFKEKGMRTFRSITVENEEIEFSQGFTDLHTRSYQQILNGNGFGLNEARPCVELTYQIRKSKSIGLVGDYHPFLVK